MSYARIEEFKARIPERDLVQLTDLGVIATGEVQDGRIQAALDDASAEIDSYIAKAVTGGLERLQANPPRILKVICRRLALYQLYIDIGHDMETRKSLRSDSISFLKSVQRGDETLGDGGDVPVEITSPGVAMTDGPERQMTRDSLRGF